MTANASLLAQARILEQAGLARTFLNIETMRPSEAAEAQTLAGSIILTLVGCGLPRQTKHKVQGVGKYVSDNSDSGNSDDDEYGECLVDDEGNPVE